MTDLRQRLHDSLDDQHTDLALLSTRAQTLGTQLRRRRRRNLATGSLALAAVLCVGVISLAQLLPASQKVRPGPGFANQGGATVPASGRTVAAALYAAVNDTADGTVDRIQGGKMESVTDDRTDEVLVEHVAASIAFTPVGSSAPGEVSLDLSRMTEAGRALDLLDRDPCPQNAVECQRSTLPDGSDVYTYRFHDEVANGDPAGSDVVYAERVIGLVTVTLSAANGITSPRLGGARLPNGPQPVLSTEQLKEIISQPWWGLELPAEFFGDDLPPSFELLHDGTGSLSGATS